MPEKVSYYSIDERVVKEFDRLMRETARERNQNVSIQQPFHVRDVPYFEVLSEVRKKIPTSTGLDYYRLMVGFLPWFDFSDKPESNTYSK